VIQLPKSLTHPGPS